MNVRRFLAVKRMCMCRPGPRWKFTAMGKPRIRRHGHQSRLEELAHLSAIVAGGRTNAEAERLITATKP